MAAGEAAQPGMEGLLLPVALIAVFYFMLIRPLQKKAKEHKTMVEALAKGDEIVTNGGLLGRIIVVGEHFVTVEVADNMQVQVMKSAVGTIMPKGTMKGKVKEEKPTVEDKSN
jgi:preprotein translocase subunit YajC